MGTQHYLIISAMTITALIGMFSAYRLSISRKEHYPNASTLEVLKKYGKEKNATKMLNLYAKRVLLAFSAVLFTILLIVIYNQIAT